MPTTNRQRWYSGITPKNTLGALSPVELVKYLVFTILRNFYHLWSCKVFSIYNTMYVLSPVKLIRYLVFKILCKFCHLGTGKVFSIQNTPCVLSPVELVLVFSVTTLLCSVTCGTLVILVIY